MILKQVIHFPDTNSVEATWVVRTVTQETVTDEQGNESMVDTVIERQVRCHSYADVQMDMLRADMAEFGGDVAEHEALIARVEAGIVPPTPTPRDEVLAQRWADIKAARDFKTQQGGYRAAGKWFHSDTFSRTQQIGLVMMGAAIPAGLMWKCMDGSYVAMTPALAQQVFAAAGAQDAALFSYAEALRARVEATPDPMSVDIEAGWPATFGDAP